MKRKTQKEKTAALKTLRAWYEQRIEEVAEELHSGFMSGKYGESCWPTSDSPGLAPLHALEDECETQFARTVAEAGLVLIASRHAGDDYVQVDGGVCAQAALAAAQDVLYTARARRWCQAM